MKIIKIKYGIDPPTYMTVTETELRRAFSSEDKFKKFINQIKEAGDKNYARGQISINHSQERTKQKR